MLHFIAKFLSRMFFRRIIISGKPYDGKPALWVGNHSNGIVDPLVMLSLSPVLLRPLAKATLWNNWVMKLFLNFTRAIPVARPQDAEEMAEEEGHIVGKVWIQTVNLKAFECVHEAIQKEQRILIFPEGLSHDDPRMHTLKTGVSRMALEADREVVIQPVVLDYSEKNEFRSELYIHYCVPIVVTPESFSVEDLMLKIQKSYNDVFIECESWDEKRNWYYLFKIFNGRIPNSLVEFKNFVAPIRQKMNEDPVLFGKVHTMRCMLQANNIKPIDSCWRKAVQNGKHNSWFFLLILASLSFVFIKGPILLLQTMIWGVPFEICNRLGAGKTYNRDVYATMKIAHGMWVFPLWMCFIPGVLTLAIHDNFPAIHMIALWCIIFALMPLTLLLGLYISENFKFCSGYFKFGVLKLTFPRALEEMLREWKNIAAAVSQKVK